MQYCPTLLYSQLVSGVITLKVVILCAPLFYGRILVLALGVGFLFSPWSPQEHQLPDKALVHIFFYIEKHFQHCRIFTL